MDSTTAIPAQLEQRSSDKNRQMMTLRALKTFGRSDQSSLTAHSGLSLLLDFLRRNILEGDIQIQHGNLGTIVRGWLE